MYRYKELENVNLGLLRDAAEKLVLMLSPFVPHICEEMWEGLGFTEPVFNAGWPSFNEEALAKESIEIVVQINGKVKAKLEVPSGLSKEEFEQECLGTDSVKALIDNRTVVKIVAVPGKLINFVVKE